MPQPVIHDNANQRFEITVDGHAAIATYTERDGVWVMDHTFVPDALRGQGVAAKLVEAAFATAREAGVKIEPACSYVARYMERHAETQDLRA
jgi:uncharacterized protein